MPAFREICSGLQFPEGPIWCSDGSVLLVEIRRGTLTRVQPDGRTEVVAECGGGPNGAAVGPDGAIFITNDDLLTTNICFGGKDLRTAFITLSSTGRLVSCDWERPGLRLAYNL